MRDLVIRCEWELRELLPNGRRPTTIRETIEPRRAIKRSTSVPLQGLPAMVVAAGVRAAVSVVVAELSRAAARGASRGLTQAVLAHLRAAVGVVSTGRALVTIW